MKAELSGVDIATYDYKPLMDRYFPRNKSRSFPLVGRPQTRQIRFMLVVAVCHKYP